MDASPTPAPGAGPSPVFVDETGRRHRWLRGVGWVAGALAAAYLVLFVISITASPGLLPLSVPGVGRLLPNASAPNIPAGNGKKRAADVVTTRSPTPAAVVPTSSTPTLTPTPTSTRGRTSPPTGRPTAVPSRTVGRTNPPSAGPSARPTAHGSPSSRPSSRGTGKPTAHPSHTPRAGSRRSPTASPAP